MSDKQMISELRKLKRIKRDPRAAQATYEAIVGKPAQAGFMAKLGWRPALAALVAAVLIIPAAIHLAGSQDPVPTGRDTTESGQEQAEHPASTKPTPATDVTTDGSNAAPAAEIAPESQAAAIEQAPVSAPAVTKSVPQKGSSWLLKQTRSQLDQLRQSNPFLR
jgi:hypothetical protein